MPRPTLEERFLAKLDLTGDECWIWTGSRNKGGYGLFYNGRNVFAHRFSYELLIGPIPDGLQIDHLCRIPSCVNPAHLEPVTARENLMRSPISPAAVNARRKYCKRGHLLEGDNVRPDKRFPQARGSCKKCILINQNERRARQRGALERLYAYGNLHDQRDDLIRAAIADGHSDADVAKAARMSTEDVAALLEGDRDG